MPAQIFPIYRSPAARLGVSVLEFGTHRIRSAIRNRALPLHAVVLVANGRGSLFTDEAGQTDIVAPTLFWLQAGTTHSYGPDPLTFWDERWALFEGPVADALFANQLLETNHPAVSLTDVIRVTDLFATLRTNMSETSLIGDAAAAATLFQLAVESARQRQASGPTPGDGAAAPGVVVALRQRAFQKVDMVALAAEFGISPATLRRRFLAQTKLAPKPFQLHVRLNRAKQLLSTTELNLDAIAAEVGYDDVFYFSRVFAAHEGCAPSEFRRRHRRQ